MKRSEMVNMMYDKFREEHIVKSETIYVSIEKLLTFMEEQGMQPPAQEYLIVDYKINPKGEKYWNGGFAKKYVNKWEPENEH